MKTFAIPVPEGRTPMVAICSAEDCRHTWIAVWLPMEMMLAATVLNGLRCPLCGHDAPALANAVDAKKFGVVDQAPIVSASAFARDLEISANGGGDD